MNIVQLSDIHLTAPGTLVEGLDTHARLARALDHMQRHVPDIARLVITGDLTHWGERSAYDALRKALSKVRVPVRLLIGNHDDRATFLEVFPEQDIDATGYVNHAETLGDTRLIYLDTVGDRTHAGHFGPEQRAWLEAELDAARHARIFLHHNPMELGLPATDKIGLIPEDRDAFRNLIRRFSVKVDFIHFGHVHAQYSGTFEGVPFAAVPSTGYQSLSDLVEPDWLYGAPMDPYYSVVRVKGRDTTVIPMAFAWDGPVAKGGTEWEEPTKAKRLV